MDIHGRTPLEVGFSDLAIGRHSVGIPPTRTGEQVVEAYLDLISLARQGQPEYFREADVSVLARETNLDAGYIRNRVLSHLTSLKVPA